MIIAQTPRVTLRQLDIADATFFCQLLNDPDWLKNIGDRGVRTPLEAERYIESNYLPTYARLGFGMYLLERNADAQALGVCGLVQRETLPQPDLGFALLHPFCGQGYAHEAASAVMAHAQTRLGLRQVLAITTASNQRSSHLLAKLGFTFDRWVTLAPDGESLRLFTTRLDQSSQGFS